MTNKQWEFYSTVNLNSTDWEAKYKQILAKTDKTIETDPSYAQKCMINAALLNIAVLESEDGELRTAVVNQPDKSQIEDIVVHNALHGFRIKTIYLHTLSN